MRADLRSTSRTMRLLLAGCVVLFSSTIASAADADARRQAIDHAKVKLLRDLDALEQYLSRGGQSVIVGWQQYLHLDAVRAELARPDPDLDRLHRVWHRFYAAEEGLHDRRFLAVRDSLRRYRTVAATPAGDLSELHAEALQQLHEQVELYRKSDARDDVAEIGPLLAWLEATGADRAEIAKIRKQFGYANAYIRVSSRLANYFLERPVIEKERVSANIGGAYTTGDAETRAKLWLHTSPATERGAIDIRLTGKTTTTNSVSQKGPVTVYGGANTTIDARVRLNLHEDLLRVEAPVVRAVTNSYINDISARWRVIERIAWRRAPREMPAAEQAAARQVEDRLRERLGKETATLMEQANNIYAHKVREPMTRRGAWPSLSYFSDHDSLHLRMHQATAYQVAAPNRPPQWPVAGDLTMAGHESMFENFFEGVFGGREIKDERFLYLMELLTGESPRPLWVHDREPRWSVIMQDIRPLRVRCRSGELLVTLAVAETLRGAERWEMPALITAKFHVDATSDGPVFRRLGDVQIEFPEREKHSEDADKLRAFLARKFRAVMPAELYFDGLAAPAGGFGDKLNQLQLREVSFKSGWATLRYELDMTKKPKAVLVRTSGLGG